MNTLREPVVWLPLLTAVGRPSAAPRCTLELIGLNSGAVRVRSKFFCAFWHSLDLD